MFKEHIVANHIHEGAETLRLAQAAVPAQNRQDTDKGLLADILNGLLGLEAVAKLELEQFREVADKVLLRLVVTCTETFHVSGIECIKLQR